MTASVSNYLTLIENNNQVTGALQIISNKRFF